MQGKTVVAITSGANMNFDRLRLVADLAAVGARQEAVFVTTIPEKIGSFQHFMDVALADTDIQITEFKYRCRLILHQPQMNTTLDKLEHKNSSPNTLMPMTSYQCYATSSLSEESLLDLTAHSFNCGAIQSLSTIGASE